MKNLAFAAAALAACVVIGEPAASAQQSASPSQPQASPSQAQPQPAAGRRQKRRARIANRFTQRFKRVDKNGDGVISRDEWPARRARAFDRLDTNHDGVVSADELRAVMAARQKPRRR